MSAEEKVFRSESREKAVQLLTHYVTLTMTKAGLKPDSDTHAELAELVDHLIDAACEEAEKRLTEKLVATRNRQNAEQRISARREKR